MIINKQIKKTRIFILFSILFIVFLSLINFITAFGVGASYRDEKPLYMAPEETKDTYLTLQNMVGEKDITLRAELVNGSEIATLTDENLDYFLPFGTQDVKVNLKIQIPKDASIGDKYKVAVFFKQVTEDEGKMLQITGGIEKSFPVIVNKTTTTESKETEIDVSNSTLLLTVVIIAIVILIVYFILKKRK